MFKQTGILVAGVIILALCIVGICSAQESGKEKASDVKTKREMLQEAKDSLDNTVWKIELKRMAGKKGKKEFDTLSFKGYKIGSDKLLSDGFTPSNYTVRVKGEAGEIIIWETMQTSGDKGVAFWRGEIRNDIMRGVLSWHLNDKKKRDYTFISLEKEMIAKEETPPVPLVQKKEGGEVDKSGSN